MLPLSLPLSLLLALPARAQTPADRPETRPDPTRFAISLYQRVAAAQPDANVFLSPVSARWALGMAYAGAEGRTAGEMARVLGALPGAEHLRFESRRRTELLSADPKVILRVGNSLWLKKGFPFLPRYVASVREAYGAEVFELALDAEAAAAANDWVSKATEGRIPTIIKEFKKTDRALILNAVYFKGTWKDEFRKKNTKDAPFLLPSGSTVQRPLMERYGKYAYFEEPGLQAVRLPYGGGRLAMIVLLPARSTPLARMNARLTPEFWSAIVSGLRERPGTVRLPRFKLEFEAPLNPALQALGMKTAFDRMSADFLGIARATQPEDRLFISEVVQKTFVEVNEEGTEAAAVTKVAMAARGMAMSRETPFEFIADHPFIYAIEDSGTRELLFLGALARP